MSFYDEYQIVITEAQRRVIMRALANAIANDRLSSTGGALTRPTQDQYMQLIRLFSTIRPSVRAKRPIGGTAASLVQEIE
jgi:monoamine oxidase